MHELARRLLAVEAGAESSKGLEAARLCEKLRVSLIRLAGTDGFCSLLKRALALSRAEIPALHTVKINPDCSIAGLSELAVEARRAGSDGKDAAAMLIGHLLGLLVTFIGEMLTLGLVLEAWPGLEWDE